MFIYTHTHSSLLKFYTIKKPKFLLAIFLAYISIIFNNLNNRKENTSITIFTEKGMHEKCVNKFHNI